MVNAPQRPPTRRSERRSPPKGPRPVARKSEVTSTRKNLEIAARVVRDSQVDGAERIAATLDALRAPYGHRMLTVDRETGRRPEGTDNLTISTPVRLRELIKDSAAQTAEGKSVDAMLGALLADKFRAVLAGDLEPLEIPREPRGSGVEKRNLNVPVDAGVLQELRDALGEIGPRLGYERKATAPQIALRLLLDEFGLDYEPSENAYASKTLLSLYVAPRLAAAFRDSGQDLAALIEAGFGKTVAGEFEPLQVPKASPGSEYERERISLYVDAALTEQVRAMRGELRESLGIGVTPQSIAIDYLVSELGLDELFKAEYSITDD